MSGTLGFAQHALSSEGVSEFTSVHVQGRIVVDIVGSDQVALDAEIANIKDTLNLTWYVQDKCLYIKLRRGIRDIPNARVKISVPHLDKVVAIDSKITLTNINSKLFDVEAIAGADVNLDIHCSDIIIKSSGTSNVKLTGSSKYMSISASSSSEVNASGFEVVSADVSTTMMSEVVVKVSERLVAQSDINSMIRYMGRPDIVRARTSVKGKVFKVD